MSVYEKTQEYSPDIDLLRSPRACECCTSLPSASQPLECQLTC